MKNLLICPQCHHDKVLVWEVIRINKTLAECDKCEHTAPPETFNKKED